MRKSLVCALAITACLIVVNLVENPLEYLTSLDGSELLERNGEQDGSFSAELDRKFEEAYNRGRADEATSINIEVPSRNIVREEAYNIKKAQKSAELTKQELLTEDEAKNDMGGLLRIEAVNSRFAHKIQGLLGSIQNKLDNAGQTENIFKPETPNADEILAGIKPAEDETWNKLLSELDSKIVYAGDHHSEEGSFEDEARYEHAFRKAFDPIMRRRSRRSRNSY
jgi:hypothetical protein